MNSLWTIFSSVLLCYVIGGLSDPQTKLLNKGVSQFNATTQSIFMTHLNATFLDLRTQIRDGSRFATAQSTRRSDPVYGMVQCRNYLSRSDCLACFDAAEAEIRKYRSGNGARVILDGCFIRYESNVFFDQGSAQGNTAVCGNISLSRQTNFNTTTTHLLSDLIVATPRIRGYFAASYRTWASGSNGTVYAIAQCVNIVTQVTCRDCLAIAFYNIGSCIPDGEGRAVDAGCFLRYSTSAFFHSNQTINLSLFLRAGGSNKKKIIIGVVAGGVAFLLIVIMFTLWFICFRKKPKRERRGDILGATELRGPVNFNYKDLISATNNFSEANKLGEGGFGDVYKGTLKNEKIVAVKKLAIGQSIRAKADFESEVKLISNVHHRNLIRLLGCCSKREELLLVYEYMANSSLDKFLYGEKRGILSWKQRLDIIVGTARGLAYLHEEFHVCIIHRDIKSSNILLDDGFQPRIADFGLARLFPEDQSHISTRFAGTLGYTAPEYAIHGQLSSKVDTYSYGVVVLEIISGRKSNDLKLEPSTQYLLEWAWRLYEEDSMMDLVDESLDPNEYDAQEVKKVIEVAMLCTQSPAFSRPAMSEVVVLLLSKGFPEYKPTRPTFIDASKRVRGDTSTSTASSTSNATVSITANTGR